MEEILPHGGQVKTVAADGVATQGVIDTNGISLFIYIFQPQHQTGQILFLSLIVYAIMFLRVGIYAVATRYSKWPTRSHEILSINTAGDTGPVLTRFWYIVACVQGTRSSLDHSNL